MAKKYGVCCRRVNLLCVLPNKRNQKMKKPRYLDKEYRHKSGLFWEKPDLAVGDQVVVYVNDAGKSAMQFFF